MKTLRIFRRDIKATFREFMCIWIITIPVILALLIRAGTPGAADSPARIGLLENENPALLTYMQTYADVTILPDTAALEARVKQRDNLIGITAGALITQGNEPKYITDAANILISYYEQTGGVIPEAAGDIIAFHSFGRTNPPLMITLGAALLVMVTILSGMIISINIVEEKVDKTIRALRVSPVSPTGFIIGKSVIGIANSVIIGFCCVIAAGFTGVNIAQVLIILLAASFVSFLVGFMAGLTGEDLISAVATLKLIILPFAASVLAVEFLSDSLHRLFYWSPFYFAYDGIKGVLTQTAGWNTVLFNAGITAALTLIIYIIAMPALRKKLL